MRPDVKIEVTRVEAKGRTIAPGWTYEEWTPPDPMRWYHNLWAWAHHLFGYASPYDTCFHGLDVEEEIIKALTEEINDN